MSSATPPPCDPEVYEKGETVCTFHASAEPTETWVKKVAEYSGQKVDWHYVGGYAVVRCVGDMGKARDAARGLKGELDEASVMYSGYPAQRFRMVEL